VRIPLIVLAAALLLPACASVEMHLGKAPAKGSVRTILLGNFEQRTTGFDPYMAANFRDAFAFELFTRGYTVILHIEKPSKNLTSADGQQIPPVKEDIYKPETAHPGYDLRIDGALCESHWGDTLKSRTGAVVTVVMSLPDGTKIAGARYFTADPLSAPSSLKKIAAGLAEKMYRSFGN